MAFDLETLLPADTPKYMLPAWVGCIRWALNTPEILAEFRKDTGNMWEPGKTGLDRMIDEACDAEARFMDAFVRWVNVNIWGPV